MHQFDAEVLPIRISTREMVLEYATCGCDICPVLVCFLWPFFLFPVCIMMFSSRSWRLIACAVKHWTSATDDALTTTTRRMEKKKSKYNHVFFFSSLVPNMGRNQSQAAEQGRGALRLCGIASMLRRRTRAHRLGNWSCSFCFLFFAFSLVLF